MFGGGPHRAGMAAWGLALAVGIAGCGPGTGEVLIPPVEIRIGGGDAQFGTLGQTLPMPLHVVLTSIRTDLPVRNAIVEWRIASGSAEIIGVANVTSDSTGSARATVRVGQETGIVTVRATVQGQEGATATFTLEAVDRPVLQSVSPTSAEPGASVTLTGENFSPNAAQNIVLFSGVRGVVTASTRTTITATVPLCLPPREVSVTTQLGSVASSSRGFTIEGGGSVDSLDVGEVLDLVEPGGIECATLPGSGGRQYLVLLQSGSAIGPASHPFSFVGLSSDGASPAFQSPRLTPGSHAGRPRLGDLSALGAGSSAVQSDWEQRLRRLEAEYTRGRRLTLSETPPRASQTPQRVPTVGERRTFSVFRNPGDFVQVDAVAEYVGARAAFFVDENAPSGGYQQADLALFSQRFDDVIYPTVTGSFGDPSDLDGNDRIVVLLSPAVNALTPRGAPGFVGGFFFGVDLLPEENGSNAGEVFYSLVPDPDGIHSDPRSRDALMAVTPAILAHEFQHMVHFNERVLALGAEANEAVWLSEGLAQYAEELVARAYEGALGGGDTESAGLFRVGAVERARRYLAGTDSVSLLVSVGQGSLTERGAGFLYLLYLADRFGPSIAGELTASTRTGVENVEFETGTEWPSLLSDWWAASLLDETSAGLAERAYPTIDLPDYLGDPFPLEPSALGGGDFEVAGSMRSASARYYIVTPAAGGSTTLRLGGEAGGGSLPQAEIRMRIIRIQ